MLKSWFKSPALLIWDIENVRLPNNLAPGVVTTMLKSEFAVRDAVTAITPRSLFMIKQNHPSFIDVMVPHCDLMLASHKSKRSADYVLIHKIGEYIVKARGNGKIVLLTGDSDFLEPVQRALASGVEVQLLYVENKTSRALLELDYGENSPIEWRQFLKDKFGGVEIELPYDVVTNNAFVTKNVSQFTQTGLYSHPIC